MVAEVGTLWDVHAGVLWCRQAWARQVLYLRPGEMGAVPVRDAEGSVGVCLAVKGRRPPAAEGPASA